MVKLNSLNKLLGNRSMIIILEFFISNSTKEISQTKIGIETNLTKATLSKFLRILKENNILNVKIEGVSKLYKLNNNKAVVRQLKILNTVINLNDIWQIKNKYNIRVYLYGSAARGENTEESDIDLLVIGNIRKEIIIKHVNDLSNKIKRKINIEVFSPLDWAGASKKDQSFYERVKKDMIEL